MDVGVILISCVHAPFARASKMTPMSIVDGPCIRLVITARENEYSL